MQIWRKGVIHFFEDSDDIRVATYLKLYIYEPIKLHTQLNFAVFLLILSLLFQVQLSYQDGHWGEEAASVNK